jgi:hypothetical protein
MPGFTDARIKSEHDEFGGAYVSSECVRALAEQFAARWQEVAWPRVMWPEFVELVGTNRTRMDLLDRATPIFFECWNWNGREVQQLLARGEWSDDDMIGEI